MLVQLNRATSFKVNLGLISIEQTLATSVLLI